MGKGGGVVWGLLGYFVVSVCVPSVSGRWILIAHAQRSVHVGMTEMVMKMFEDFRLAIKANRLD